ncbi:hypothetical protein GCM10011581_21130 [Saccharopolyspora subtropica]|uniref:Uncharacterized protein n=1 Tax=Saccharopolyspora thermophila TaxID=89367 RepID=A0A917NCE9_9PSEU|nr:hypothetical protein GCM10011581_21130 [Saccharopolyspora subtropica]
MTSHTFTPNGSGSLLTGSRSRSCANSGTGSRPVRVSGINAAFGTNEPESRPFFRMRATYRRATQDLS